MARDNPLSTEQLKTLQGIAKLLPEEQKEKLPAFLKTLSPEQMAFLKQQQSQGACPFCFIVGGKLESKAIYEDDVVLAVLDIRPAIAGHVLVLPKKHYAVLGQMDGKEVAHLFSVASKVASLLFETLEAAGTNIYVASGQAAGQTVEHVLVHVIPRFKDDGVTFPWSGQEVPDAKLDELKEKLTGKIHFQETVVQQKPVVEEAAEAAEERMPDF